MRDLQLDIVIIISGSAEFGDIEGGLLGNLNNDATDDLILKNGTVIPHTSTTQEIHEQFGESCEYYTSIIMYCVRVFL